MVIQLADKDGRQIKELENVSIDAELNDGNRDFQITIPISDYDERMTYRCRVFAADTEIGGILGELGDNTSAETITWKGYNWRGYMAEKVIEPPSGQDYYTVTGELNNVLRDLIEPRFGGVFVVPETDTGVTVSGYQFARYCTLLDGLTDMLQEVGYRLNIRYNEGEPNECGYVVVEAVPIVDYSSEIELSQDSQLNFKMQDKRNGVNHLIVLGKGELKDRTVIHLYVQEDGSIGNTQYYSGIDEIERVYENTSADDSELRSEGIKQLRGLMDKQTFEMDVEALGIDVAIGDIIGGRDFITGMYMAKPVENIIVKIKNGIVSKEYKLEGN